ncbi:MAG: dienelactone hydrolase family protein [Actinomycetota bacterium]
MEAAERYRKRTVEYAGVVGVDLDITSANPVNFHEAITAPASCAPQSIDAKLFAAQGAVDQPTVMVVPGSLGVGPNHEAHAETLVEAGYVVCVLDPFGPRSVASTVGDQTQYSFAASAWDVLATLCALAARPEVDPMRVAAQGHSRGGSAVTIASCRRFADAIVGSDIALAATYAVYPWCGQQFLDPSIGPTNVRAIIGDLDEWCSVQQVQAQIQAMRLSGGAATIRVVPGAHHSFDRHEPVHTIEEASVAPAAPTTMLGDDGAMIPAGNDRPDPDLVDGDVFRTSVTAGLGRLGAAIGGTAGQPELFRRDMLDFYAATIGRGR